MKTKPCLYCNREFHKNPRLSLSQWEETVYCSQKCMGLHRKRRPVLTSIFNNIEIDPVTRCWIWQGSCDSKGYGLTTYEGKGNQKTHRVVYSVAVGDIPPGWLVLHRCDRPPCCNPFHLFIGDTKDNSDDMFLKNRAAIHRGEKSASARLTEAEVLAIRNDPRTQDEIAKEYQIAQTTVSAIKRKVNWAHLQQN